MNLLCTKCDKGYIESKRWWLDRIVGWQVRLVANKPKYPPQEFKDKYDRSEKLIKKIDPEFYKDVRV